MATVKYVAGGVSSWTAAFTASTLNSITNGNAILSDAALDNTSNLDTYAAVGIQFGAVTTVAPNFIGVYLYPLNQDGSTYGDARFGSSAAGPPASNYFVGNIVVPIATTTAFEGTLFDIKIPPLKFKFVMYNQSGVTLAGSGGNSFYWQTYNYSVA